MAVIILVLGLSIAVGRDSRLDTDRQRQWLGSGQALEEGQELEEPEQQMGGGDDTSLPCLHPSSQHVVCCVVFVSV